MIDAPALGIALDLVTGGVVRRFNLAGKVDEQTRVASGIQLLDFSQLSIPYIILHIAYRHHGTTYFRLVLLTRNVGAGFASMVMMMMMFVIILAPA